MKNVYMNSVARNTPTSIPTNDRPAQIIEEIVTAQPERNDEVLNEEQIPILKPCIPILKQDLPRMMTLPILAFLPNVASLPAVNIGQKMAKELITDDDQINMPDESLDIDEEIGEVEENAVTVNVLQEVKYEIIERKSKKSPILHRMRRIEEFKRNIFIDRQRDKPQNVNFY
nr:uncharacterized protein LOC128681610 isoform X2 [Plodia interpunctella]